MENTRKDSPASQLFLATGRDVFQLHILPITALDWLFVSKEFHEIAFNNLLRDPRIIKLILESRPLSRAVSLRSARAVSLLLSHPLVNPNEGFSLPMITAIQNGDEQIADILLQDSRTKISYYFLDICISRRQTDISKLILKRGINFEDDQNFNRVVAKACEYNLPELVALLVDTYENKYKIDINQALEISVICKHQDLVKFLLDRRPEGNRINAKVLLSMANYRTFEVAELLSNQAQFIDIDEKSFKELIMRTRHAKRNDVVQLLTDKLSPVVIKSSE